MKRRKGYVDRSETYDDFLAKDGLLADAEKVALKEIAVDLKGHIDVRRVKRSEPAAE